MVSNLVEFNKVVMILDYYLRHSFQNRYYFFSYIEFDTCNCTDIYNATFLLWSTNYA